MPSYNFKDNLTVDNNKYLNWMDASGTARKSIIALDASNNVKLMSATGDVFINSDAASPSSTYFHIGNSGNVLVASKLGVGVTDTALVTSQVTLAKNSHIGSVSTDGYVGIGGSNTLNNVGGARVLLYGNNAPNQGGSLGLFAGNVTAGSIKLFVNNDSQVVQIASTGSTIFTPNGSTPRLTVADLQTTVANQTVFTDSTQSDSPTSGSVRILGGLGVRGNTFVGGTLTVESLNFNSTMPSENASTGSLLVTGGVSIRATANAANFQSGGGITVAGGAAVEKNVIVGGSLEIVSDSTPTNSLSGALIVRGGAGVNGDVWLRSSASPQLRIAPSVNDGTTSIQFANSNDFSSTGAWSIGQSVTGTAIGAFGISFQTTNAVTVTTNGNVGIGMSNPSRVLDVTGNSRVSGDILVGGVITSSSDVRLKENVRPLDFDGVSSLLQTIHSVRYNYVGDSTEHIGFLAQDVLKSYPELVRQDVQTEMLSVDYARLVVVLLECVKELHKRLQAVEQRGE